MQYETLSPQNQFSFVCPMFNTEVKFSGCVKLRELVWKGHRPEVRRGCQACMSACKCPVTHIVQRMAMSQADLPDTYASDTPRVGKLHYDVLNHLLPIIVMDHTIKQFNPSAAEIALIESASARIEAQMQAAPTGEGKRKAPKSITPTAAKGTPRAMPNARIAVAAETGDLSAAINTGDKV